MPTHDRRRLLVGIAVVALAGVVTVDAARRIAQWPEYLSQPSGPTGRTRCSTG